MILRMRKIYTFKLEERTNNVFSMNAAVLEICLIIKSCEYRSCFVIT